MLVYRWRRGELDCEVELGKIGQEEIIERAAIEEVARHDGARREDIVAGW